MTIHELGVLSSDRVDHENFNVAKFDATDTFVFDIVGDRVLNLYLHDISIGGDADLYLYADTNNNGIVDTADQLLTSSINGSNADDIIRFNVSDGHYIAVVERYEQSDVNPVFYDFDLSAIYDVGTLTSTILPQTEFTLSASDPTDVFEFDLSSDRVINLYLNNISIGDDADLTLYADSNNNGIFDDADQLLASSINASNTDDVIRYAATAGTYFAQVERYDADSIGSVSYDLDLSAIYDVGTLSDTITSQNDFSVTAVDPTDVFEFDIFRNQRINLFLHNISAQDDADLRLYDDSNNNGILDADDQLLASSINSSNANDIIRYDAIPGTYFAQVERYDLGSIDDVFYDLDLYTTTSFTTYVLSQGANSHTVTNAATSIDSLGQQTAGLESLLSGVDAL